jgi:ribosome biogenesis GTPase / thiamine phosphate phosphatase
MNLEKLGFDESVKQLTDPVKLTEYNLARVISVNRNSFVVSEGNRDIFAELSGKFLFDADSSVDLPAAGDWVYVRLFDENSIAVIHDVMPRKSLLKRKTAGKKIDYQLIAANIDNALIVQGLDTDYNLRRLERYMVMVNQSGISPVVLLSKKDLLSPENVKEKEEAVLKLMPGVKVISYSSNSGEDIDKIKDILIPYKTYCLLGSSGVGKSTLLNKILHEELIKTQPVKAKDGKGKHTTTKRELVILENGAIIIDTPGMRELGLIETDTGLEETFNDITSFTGNCRFRDCTHTVEEGCALLLALEEGRILPERYSNYIKMYKESAHYRMSYVEKREKDKKFGKFIHHYLKNKRDKN